uniref:Uncharacterized protein n=1 Tax=Lepeophtheirus salmonis TaxID=72036 RepID=A0A0K2TVA7_LEPSM
MNHPILDSTINLPQLSATRTH